MIDEYAVHHDQQVHQEVIRRIRDGCICDSTELLVDDDVVAECRRLTESEEWYTVVTRCASTSLGTHSGWAYGPVYVSKAAAIRAGHLYKIECSCGVKKNLLF